MLYCTTGFAHNKRQHAPRLRYKPLVIQFTQSSGFFANKQLSTMASLRLIVPLLAIVGPGLALARGQELEVENWDTRVRFQIDSVPEIDQVHTGPRRPPPIDRIIAYDATVKRRPTSAARDDNGVTNQDAAIRGEIGSAERLLMKRPT